MSDLLKLGNTPHRRWNPLSREWTLVSPQRTQRPWQGQIEQLPAESRLQYDPACYLCPGNTRADGRRNPEYASTLVFENDFPALLPDSQQIEICERDLMIAKTERGLCRVICFSPRHDLTISNMPRSQVRDVVEVWAQQYAELGRLDWVQHVQIFENRGEMMGASNPHPHCQLWANETIPNIPKREQESQADYFAARHRCLLCEYLSIEERDENRLVCANKHFVAVVPFWAVWPFEVLVVSRAHIASIDGLYSDARDGLAEILQRITARYDNLFHVSFPYSMGFHQQPTDGLPHPEWHLHAHFFPPLLRSANIRKFMVGYEMLASPQRDLTPERAAELLRNCSERALESA
jgi:UDPglucose--hexose-1-phosphate uridylyltransferase